MNASESRAAIMAGSPERRKPSMSGGSALGAQVDGPVEFKAEEPHLWNYSLSIEHLSFFIGSVAGSSPRSASGPASESGAPGCRDSRPGTGRAECVVRGG